MNKENQLYQLIPAPAGDWQEGDKLQWVDGLGWRRLRPVKAQSGQPEFYDMPDGLDFRNGGQKCDMLAGPCACGAWHKLEDLPYRIFHQLKAVPAQACACEGLRKIAEEAESQLRADGYIYLPDKLRKALAQSCQPSVSHSVQQPDLSGGDLGPRGFKSKTSIPASAPPAQNISEKGGPANLSREERHWRQREAQNISERGDASCREQQNNENTEFGTTSASNAAPESFDPTRVAAEEKALDALVAMALHPNSDEIQAKVAAKLAEPPAAASEAQLWTEHTVNGIVHVGGYKGVAEAHNATVAALRLELAEAKKAKHRAGQLWPKLIQAEDDRDQWQKRAEKAEQANKLWTAHSRSQHWQQWQQWHDYATDPPKEEDGVVRSYGYAWIWLSLPSGGLRLVHWSHVPVLPGCKWARITWPAVPAEPVQDKDEEAAQYAADHIFQPLMGEVTISDSQHRVIRNYAITVAKAALSHARATEGRSETRWLSEKETE